MSEEIKSIFKKSYGRFLKDTRLDKLDSFDRGMIYAGLGIDMLATVSTFKFTKSVLKGLSGDASKRHGMTINCMSFAIAKSLGKHYNLTGYIHKRVLENAKNEKENAYEQSEEE